MLSKVERINRFIVPSDITGKKYYLYIHIRKDTDEIFYVGIGTMNRNTYGRAIADTGRNTIWKSIVSKTKYNVIIFSEADTKEEILQKEINYIALLGRKTQNRGELCNLTDGGEGSKGVHTIKYSKPVLQINKETGEIIREFSSVKEANSYFSLKYSISATIRKGHISKGFIWRYKDPELQFKIEENLKNAKNK